ncbi:hypothetical protein [Bartonella jaculi]|uniref:Uncharacterized protein n=1 Tax=Bartonella jaculi TaxID=686226 RepID=A0ABP9N7D0_9HYPH
MIDNYKIALPKLQELILPKPENQLRVHLHSYSNDILTASMGIVKKTRKDREKQIPNRARFPILPKLTITLKIDSIRDKLLVCGKRSKTHTKN